MAGSIDVGMRAARLAVTLSTLAGMSGCELAVTPIMLQREVGYVSCAECGGDLRRYAVDPNDYPVYRAALPIVPPEQVSRKFAANSIGLESGIFDVDAIPIASTDDWHVTHVVDGVYLVQSSHYSDRLCRHSMVRKGRAVTEEHGVCSPDPDASLGIFLRPGGDVVSGWIGLSSRFLVKGHYAADILKLIRLEPVPGEVSGWNTSAAFIAVGDGF